MQFQSTTPGINVDDGEYLNVVNTFLTSLITSVEEDSFKH